jgi:hypothetical protein
MVLYIMPKEKYISMRVKDLVLNPPMLRDLEIRTPKLGGQGVILV